MPGYLLGRICNPTAISMSICNAGNGKRKRIINPYTKCCRITNTAERGKSNHFYIDSTILISSSVKPYS